MLAVNVARRSCSIQFLRRRVISKPTQELCRCTTSFDTYLFMSSLVASCAILPCFLCSVCCRGRYLDRFVVANTLDSADNGKQNAVKFGEQHLASLQHMIGRFLSDVGTLLTYKNTTCVLLELRKNSFVPYIRSWYWYSKSDAHFDGLPIDFDRYCRFIYCLLYFVFVKDIYI